MPAKRGKKNAQLGLEGKIGAEWHRYGEKISSKQRKTNVGAGLLANAVRQSLKMSTERPHSRASPLPHGFLGEAENQTRIEVPVISCGFSSPININIVGATSASTPPSRTLKSRLPT
ncbi:hypothetical protein [Pseudomonas sp. 24 E 1]|nr:hypothetical protein [Pseudomonas sp. 24 E 1]CRM11650.1 hypothetical protein [Pseudomonas sp. 24 R 17]CRM42397.1 hypothetical protein [Pseudomonas sp. 35 E 8]CRM70898.1 hypothetical protein [Pseudomonas sp. 52 E 6]